jgi:hypothetical protein
LTFEKFHHTAADSIEKHKQRELPKIDVIESEAVKGWERSIGIHKVTTTKKITIKAEDGGSSAKLEAPACEISVKSQVMEGNPRFLDTVLKCIDARRKILGLDAPANIKVDGHQDDIDAVLGARAMRLPQNDPQ